jgi:hypothetical protein
VARAQVALKNKTGKIIAIVFRNFDGAHGRRLLHAAHIPQNEFLLPGMPRMAEVGRISAVTTGTTEGNDVFQLKYNGDARVDHPVSWPAQRRPMARTARTTRACHSTA